jgi:hypothetical protein
LCIRFADAKLPILVVAPTPHSLFEIQGARMLTAGYHCLHRWYTIDPLNGENRITNHTELTRLVVAPTPDRAICVDRTGMITARTNILDWFGECHAGRRNYHSSGRGSDLIGIIAPPAPDGLIKPECTDMICSDGNVYDCIYACDECSGGPIIAHPDRGST